MLRNDSKSGITTVIDLFENCVRQHPDQIALEFLDTQLSYAQLNERANLVAGYLVREQLQKDELVAICLERSLEMVVGIWGILKAGGAYVPIDPGYPGDRIAFILKDTGSRFMLTTGNLAHLAVDREGVMPVVLDQLDPQNGLQVPALPKITPGQLAYVIYTSGSTGMPKGVMIEHGSLSNRLQWAQQYYRLQSSDIVLQKTTYCFDVSVWELIWPLMAGARLVMLKPEGQKDNQYLKEVIESRGITMLHFVPSMLGSFLHTIQQGDCPGVQKVLCSGEALKYAHVTLFQEKLPQAELHNLYGPTEAAIDVTYWDINKEFDPAVEIIPIGRPVSNTSIYILDEKNEQLPDGEIGELHIGGVQVARGYLNKPELTAERFIPDPFSAQPGARMYKSGDLARYLPDGNIEYLGRIDHQVKVRGFRIELGEIEYQLASQENIREVVVTAFETRNGDQRLVAYLELKNKDTDQGHQIARLKKHLVSTLPAYMVPDMFMILDNLPINANGKIDRKKLPAPSGKRPQLRNLFRPPEGEAEHRLAALWSELLLIDEIGSGDNFFDLGGNSLLAQQLVTALKSRHGQDLPITKLYQHPTIQDLAKYLKGELQSVRKIPTASKASGAAVAVIGMECNFPGARGVDAFWELLREGRETTRFFTAEELDPFIPEAERNDSQYVKARGVLDDVTDFDAEFFAIPPRLAELMDPQHRQFLEVSRNLLEKTGYLPEQRQAITGVFAGCATNTYFNNNVIWHRDKLEIQGTVPVSSVSDKDYIASRVSYQLNLTGPAVNLNTACSTSLVAVAQAVESLRAGQCDTAIAGGAAVTVPVYSGHLYQEGSMLSADGHCRPFDADARGTVFSDGVGAVLLKRLDDAVRDGDTVYAVISGVGISNDGGHKGSFTAPSTEGQAAAISMALADAQTDPAKLSYVETHGTATPLGDPIEIEGLRMAFGPQEKNQYCAIGSVKSNFGHLTHAAGVAGLIKTVLSLYHKQLPATINFKAPNPHIDFASSPFRVQDQFTDWTTADKRIAGVSSFGVGGTNAHVILEEFVSETSIKPVEPTHQQPALISWSAHQPDSILAWAAKLRQYVQADPDISLQDLAYSLHVTRPDLAYRNFLVARNPADLLSLLQDEAAISAATREPGSRNGHLAFLFPGQGSQFPNMGRQLYNSQPVFREAVDTCANLLLPVMGRDIRQLIYVDQELEAAAETLKDTRYAQPAIFVTSYALARLYMSWGLQPTCFAGHSLGEFLGAHLAGVFSLEHVLQIIAERGRLMSELPRGSMLTVRASLEDVMAQLPEGVSLASQNAAKLCVVAGETEKVTAFAAQLTQAGIVNKLLQTSHAFHSEMMDPVLPRLQEVVAAADLGIPRIPVLSTVTGQWLKDEEARNPAYWARHARATVLFGKALHTIEEELHPLYLELGPGNSSAVFAKQNGITEGVFSTLPINSEDEPVAVISALGGLWQHGVRIDWKRYYGQATRPILQNIPTYAFHRKRYWLDPPAQLPTGQSAPAAAEPAAMPAEAAVIIDPRERICNKLLQLIENLSGIPVAGANPRDNFTALGLDSLLLTQLASTLKKEFALPVSFRQLSEDYDSPEKLVDYYEAHLPPEPVVAPVTAAAAATPPAAVTSPATVAGPTPLPQGNEDLLQQMLQQIQALSARMTDLQAAISEPRPLQQQATGEPEPETAEKQLTTTESQKEIIAACLLGDRYANLAYNLSLSLHLEGDIQETLLVESLDLLLQRHESLRANFSDDGAMMIIHGKQQPDLRTEDISGRDRAAQQAFLEQFLQQDAEKEFDLFQDRLIRFALFRLSPSQWVLTLTAHHVICDGWSLGVILEDISRIYNSLQSGTALPARPYSFSAYAAREAAFLQTTGYQQVLEYWKKEYEGPLPVFEITPDFPRPPVRTYTGRRDDYQLPVALVRAVKQTGAGYGSSFVNTLMSVFEMLLHKITGSQDVFIGLPTAGQAATEMYQLVGHCVNLLPLRSHLDPDTSFADYLRQRKSKTLNDYEHQQITFGSLLRELKIPRDLSRMPLVPVSMNIDLGMDTAVQFNGASFTLVHNKRVAETYELFVNVADGGGDCELQWSYNTQLYKPERIRQLMDQYRFLLEQIVSNPEQEIGAISLVDQAQLKAGWEQWNKDRDEQLYQGTMLEKLQEAFRNHAAKTALVFKGEKISYQQLDHRSNQLAQYLVEKGLSKGQIVGVALERSVELVVSLLAVVKTGAVFLPLDPQYALDRIGYMLDNAQAGYLLTDSRFKGKLTTTATEICISDLSDTLDAYSGETLNLTLEAEDLVYILYTSGSTGRPKGVMIANRSLVNYISWAIRNYLKGTPAVLPLYTSISFDLTITSIFAPLVSGSCLKIFEEGEPAAILERIFTDPEINVVKLTPSHLKLVRDSETVRAGRTSQHRTLIVGGEELETSLAREIHELYQGNIRICNEYGPTEATVGCMIHDYNPAEQQFAVPIGIPITNASIYVLNSSLQLVPAGIIGEIYIGGICLAQGYYRNEDMTRDRFLEDPFVPGARMYKTGDNAVMQEDGLLQFKGRIDDQIKLRGYRIELGEIEYHLGELSGVQSAVTMLRKSSSGNEMLVAYLTVHDGISDAETLKEEWRQQLHKKLPDYMVPAAFVILDELPLTANGKVAKDRLPEPEFSEKTYRAPQTASEQLLAGIWQEIFGREQIGLDDNFFELGGHSLLAVRMAKMVKARSGRELGATSVFRYPVLHQLATQLDPIASEAGEAESSSALHTPQSAPVTQFRPTEPQVEIWQECVIGGTEANISYNVGYAEFMEGPLDVEVLKSAFRLLMDRHQLLTASFAKDGSAVRLRPEAVLPFEFRDLRVAKADTADPEQLLQQQLDQPFDLEKDLLFRVAVIQYSDTKFLFSFVIHHLICDGGSFDVLMEELAAGYNSLIQGQQPQLPQAVPYSSFADQQQQRYQGEAYRQDLQYWLQKFSGGIPSVELPTDFPRSGSRTYKCKVGYYTLPEPLSERAAHLAAQSNSTLTILLRTLFELLVSRYTGQQELVLGLPVNGYVNVPGYHMVGHSVNMLPVSSQVDENENFQAFYKRRSQEMFSDYEHQQITLGALIRQMKIKRNAGKSTLISVCFSSQMEKSGHPLQFTNIQHQTIEGAAVNNNLELFIDTYKEEGQLKFQVIYNQDLFLPGTIDELMANYRRLLESVLGNPTQRISGVLSEAPAVMDSRLEAWNRTEQTLPQQTVVDLFEKAAVENADRPAIQFGKEQLTYKELQNEVARYAAYFRSNGIGKGTVAAVAVQRHPRVIITLLALLKSGATYLPLDPGFPEERIRYMLEDSKAGFIVINQADAGKFGAGSTRELIVEQLEQAKPATGILATDPGPDGEDLAYLLYTSGSTGKPKGVMVTHRNLLNLLLGARRFLKTDTETRWLAVTTVSFDIAAMELFLPLISGSMIFLADAVTAKSGESILKTVADEGINLLQATPVTYKMMIDAGWTQRLPLRLISGGEALSKTLAGQLLERVDALYNMYGPTETTIYSTATEILDTAGPITIGRPIQNTRVYILDDRKQLVETGQVGEIYIGGEGVARGYLNRPELTAEKFTADPFLPGSGARIYATGDLGQFLEDGRIVCLGRTDNQAKIRGYRIELGEIEYHLSRQEGIRDVVVQVEGTEAADQKLVAYLLPALTASGSGQEISKNEILNWRRALSKALPDYMIPNAWVKLDAFPLTPNNKVDRKALSRAAAGQHIPVPAAQEPNRLHHLIQEITAIWEEEIGIKGIEADDDFFELGGHSMIAVKVMGRIREELHADVPIAALFEHATISSLAKFIKTATKLELKSLVPIKTTGSRIPIYFIHGGALNILLYKQLEPFLEEDQPFYGVQALGLDGDLTDLKSIETIAASYLSEIMEQNPDGPYILVGYSFGGVVAFEMARQLLAAGKEIRMLGVLDTNVSTNFVPDSRRERVTNFLKRQVKKSLFIGSNLIRYPREVLSYQLLFLNRKLNPRYQEEEEEQIYDYSKEVVRAYQDAYASYRLKPLDVKIHLFKVKERIYFVDDLEYLGWKKYARNGVEIRNIPGDHKTFLLPPNNQVLIETVQNIVRKL
ncbi:hypothetical protein GCM10027051_28220 [Niabella terrae]